MSAQSDQQYDDQPERRRPFSTLLSSLSPNSGDDRETTDAAETTDSTGTDEDFETAPQPTFTARADVPDASATEPPATAFDLDPVEDTADEPVSGTVYEAGPTDEPLDDDAVDDGVPVVVTDEVVTEEDVYDEPVDDVAATSTPVPPAPRANGEALPGFRRASTDGDSARAFPKHAAPDEVDEPVTDTVSDAQEPVAPVPSAAPATSASVVDEPLLSDAADFRVRWQQTQAGFVDDPRQAVGEAADLIEQTAQALVVAVRQRQRQLRESWDATPEAHGTDPASVSDTEQLRLMMQRYRALFNQLCRP